MGTGDSRPPLPFLLVYLCSETPVAGELERLGNGLSNGYHLPGKSGLETDDLGEE